MTISKRMLLPLVAVLMAGIGLAMYVGLQIGVDLGAGQGDLALSPASATAATHGADECPVDGAAAAADAAADAEAAEHHERDGQSGGGSSSVQEGNFATNSGTVERSQFTDGGFGDIGQQWKDVTVNGDVNNVHISTSDGAAVGIGDTHGAPPTTTTVPYPDPDTGQPVEAATTTTSSTTTSTTTSTTLPPTDAP